MGEREEEQVPVLDEDGTVVGVRPRSEVRRLNLRHAATGVVLRSSDGRVFVHRRAATKDWQPSAHDAAAGGVLQAGEEPAAAAARELAEELGVTGAPLRPLLLGRYDDATTRYVAHLYEATHDGPVRFADGEVVWGTWMTLPELGRLLRDPEWPFVPDTRALLQELAAGGVGDYATLVDRPSAGPPGHAPPAEGWDDRLPEGPDGYRSPVPPSGADDPAGGATMADQPATTTVPQPVTDDSIKVRHVSHYQFSWVAQEPGQPGVITMQLVLDQGAWEEVLTLQAEDAEVLQNLLRANHDVVYDVGRRVLMFGTAKVGG